MGLRHGQLSEAHCQRTPLVIPPGVGYRLFSDLHAFVETACDKLGVAELEERGRLMGNVAEAAIDVELGLSVEPHSGVVVVAQRQPAQVAVRPTGEQQFSGLLRDAESLFAL